MEQSSVDSASEATQESSSKELKKPAVEKKGTTEIGEGKNGNPSSSSFSSSSCTTSTSATTTPGNSSAPEESIADMVDLRELLRQHKSKISELRGAVGDRLNVKSCQQADNLFLLRFVVSYKGDTEKACEAVHKALDWRKKHVSFVKAAILADHYRQSVEFPLHMQPFLPIIRTLLAAWSHKYTINGQPTVFIRINCCNFPLLVNIVPLEVIRDYVIFSNEVEFWWCDRKTRQTGRVHKCYRFIDLKGMSTKSVDRKFLKVFEQSSKISEFLHPQLVAQTILLNAPSFIRWVVEALKAVGVSRRALEKLWVHKLLENKEIAEHEDILRLVSKETMPTFLGGFCSCEGGCVPGSPNDRTEPVEVDVAEAKKEIRENKRRIIARRQKLLEEHRAAAHLPTSSSPTAETAGNSSSSETQKEEEQEVERPKGLPPRLSPDHNQEDHDYDIPNDSSEDEDTKLEPDSSFTNPPPPPSSSLPSVKPGVPNKAASNGDEFYDAEEVMETLMEKLESVNKDETKE